MEARWNGTRLVAGAMRMAVEAAEARFLGGVRLWEEGHAWVAREAVYRWEEKDLALLGITRGRVRVAGDG